MKVIFIIGLLFGVAFSVVPIKERKFQWQIHSFNDVREVYQILRKGSTLLKIDLYYVPQSQCYSDDKRITSDPRGCFLLTHDEPYKSKRYFSVNNYFDELLKYAPLLQNDNFEIAFCFKNTPKDICKGDKNKWLKLVDDLYDYTTNLVEKNRLNVLLIYDGKKLSCVQPKWPKWLYTWIRGRDPDQAFYSDKGNYRKFYIFNDDESKLEGDKNLSWGKFKDIPHPLQLWEPNHQKDMQYFADIFLSNPHPYGYAYAINVDTSMYQVYTAQKSGENFNYNLINSKNASMKFIGFEIIGKSLYLFNLLEKEISFYTIDSNKEIKPIRKSITEVKFGLPDIKETFSLGTYKDTTVFFVSSKNGMFDLLFIKDNRLDSQKSYSLNDYHRKIFSSKMKGIDSVYVSSFEFVQRSAETVGIMVAYVGNANQQKINVMLLSISLKQTLVITNQPIYIELDDAVESVDIKCNTRNCILVVKTASSDLIMSHLIEYYKNEIRVIASPWKSFGVGTNFSLSVSREKFIFVKDDAFCYHTEESNKDAYTFVCDQKEKKIPHILNYIYGDINSGILSKEDDFGSVCSKNTISGTYDMGDNPKVKGFLNNNNKFEFIEIHDGLNKYTFFDKNCGKSNFFTGIVVDNWNLGDVEVKKRSR